MRLFQSIKTHYRAYRAFPTFPAPEPSGVRIPDPFPFMDEEEDMGVKAVRDLLPIYKSEDVNTLTIRESLNIAHALGWKIKNIYPTGEEKVDGEWCQTFDITYRTNP
jgi:hypothetical protein